jgi:hypothetical protein
VTFTTLPSGTIGGNNDALVIMYPEPQLRRDPRAEFTIGSTLSVADAAGFADTVKDGTPFTLSAVDDGGGNFTYFPQVVLVEGTDAAAITSTTQGEVAPVVYRTPGAVVLDISAQTFGGASDVNYAFKVFGGAAAQANWSNLGTGTFIYSPTAIAPGGPAGVDFGVNVFDDLDRGDLALANADFTLKSVNGSSINTPESDVLYIELANYGFYEFVTADPFDYDLAAMSAKNTRLRVTPDGGGTSMDVNLVPCAANLGVNGNTLVMYEFTNESFSNIGTPGWPGILSPGSQYDLTLVDPASPVSDFTFTSQLIVTGANPN